MRLVIKSKISERRQRLYQEAFAVIIRELGIENKHYTVQLEFHRQGQRYDPEQNGFGMEYGATYGMIVNGNIIKMRINEHQCDCPACSRHKNFPLKTFCHEMVHVAQMVQGRLVHAYWNPSIVKWNGQWERVPSYKDRPWEHEAEQWTPYLYEKLREKMGRKEAA